MTAGNVTPVKHDCLCHCAFAGHACTRCSSPGLVVSWLAQKIHEKSKATHGSCGSVVPRSKTARQPQMHDAEQNRISNSPVMIPLHVGAKLNWLTSEPYSSLLNFRPSTAHIPLTLYLCYLDLICHSLIDVFTLMRTLFVRTSRSSNHTELIDAPRWRNTIELKS